MLRSWTVAVGLIAVVAVAHGGGMNGEFHYDDKMSIKENLAIRQWQPLFYLTSPAAASAEPGTAGYRPLTVATFALNYMVDGVDPQGYLVVNLLLHLAVSWLVFVVGRQLLCSGAWAAVAAVVYAVHPVNAEAVNYAVARSSLLATCGGLIACWAFLRRENGGPWWWTGAGAAAFLAALLSKESAAAVLVPIAAYRLVVKPDARLVERPLLWDRWRRYLVSISAYLAVFLVYLAVWWNVVGSHVVRELRPAAFPGWTMMEVMGRSLLLWIWPHPLGLDHPLVFISQFDLLTAAWLTLVAVGLVGLVVASLRGRPLVAWCTLWTAAGMAPLAPLPWMTVKALMQENRMAFSAVGLALLTAIAVREASERWYRVAPTIRSTLVRRAVPVLAASVAVIGLSFAVLVDRSRSAVWADDIKVWSEVVSRSPGFLAYVNLGVAYVSRDDFERAEDAFREAVRLKPEDARPYYALGTLANRRERHDEAKQWFVEAAARAPDSPKTFRMLGLTAIKQDRDEEAGAFLRRALMLDSRDAAARAGLGLLAQRAGDDGGAVRFYLETLELDPDQALARHNLGALYLKHRRWAEALEQFSALLDHAPNDHEAALNRALALGALGRTVEARTALRALLDRLPPDPRFEPQRQGAFLILSRLEP